MNRMDAARWSLFAVVSAIGAGLLVASAVGWWLDREGADLIDVRAGELPGTGREIAVYVTGAVASPGVYLLRDGDRVEQALAAAGGPAAAADLERVNLARRLRDEDQVTVPRVGQPAPQPIEEVAGLASPVDLNTATAGQLEALPGIGEVYAQRIIESREADGPFSLPDDLVARKLIPRATLDKIRPYVTVATGR